MKNVFERVCIMLNDTALNRSYLPPEIEDSLSESASFVEIPEEIYDIESVVDEVTLRLIRKALKKSRGNTTKAAQLPGIPRGTLGYKIDKLKI